MCIMRPYHDTTAQREAKESKGTRSTEVERKNGEFYCLVQKWLSPLGTGFDKPWT
ncbi:hypothetical protein BT96DRAFT_922427 [Gymnopus androsaceus JB14]|uniref:Uncharacterized protein n=1 Tax=Gymnopus androsaceus JB14 TaxID=1447944 RepID=A0A6A4HA86_9AGAR|nr:hypothetical protein BT96DRAFT_923073 [Gymnopus androsaceus JB14]KAE9395965.1 hypothetical protein BT96DRAFT_922427 [Gymnopus androsaceus JB14]